MSSVDMSLPLASVLKAGTIKAHEIAEHSSGASRLVNGELDRDEYVKFLMALWYVYHNLELALDRHASHPTLAPTYNPRLLSRAPSLVSDISFLLQVPESAWHLHPMHAALFCPLPAPLAAYVRRLRQLADAEDPSPLLAHAYVRYLGDLSGGQIIKRRIAKAYGLDPEDGSGLSFYAFRELEGGRVATIGDMKKIKDWFRGGMDEGAGDDRELKAVVLDEALTAFELNNGLFSLLGPPLPKTSVEPNPTRGAGLTLTNGVSLLAALCLAHFVMVAGNVSPSKGCLMLHVLGMETKRFLQSSS